MGKLNTLLTSAILKEAPLLAVVHGNCTDGTGALIAIMCFCEKHGIENLEVHYAMYGENKYPDVAGKNVIISDFSYDRDTLLAMEAVSNNLYVIDHHSSAEQVLDGLDFCYFDMNHSGCVLTWMLLLRNESVPMLLRYIEDRDIWKFELPSSKEVSAALSLLDKKDLPVWFYYLDDTNIPGLIANGTVLVQYQNNKIDKVIKSLNNNNVRIITFEGYIVPIINNSDLVSEIGNALAKDFPFSIQYFITKDKLVLSFRSDNKVDLTKLTIPNGHPNAAGFNIDLDKVDLNQIYTSIDFGIYLKKLLSI